MSQKEKVSTPPSGPWMERAEAELQGAGYRSSAPRTAVLELVGRQDCVLTAHEINEELGRRGNRVGIATIYRTLEVLEDLKLVQRLDVGGGSARYEPALPGGEHHHHHFVCDDCGKVTPFEDEGLERAIARLGERMDHSVGEHDVILRGKCPGCA